jgi:GxxExxY protein
MSKSIQEICDIIRETSFDIHCYLKSGHLEKIYENSLFHRLTKKGLDVKQQYPIKVKDEDGTILGDFFADLFVENAIIVELKACSTIVKEHVAQILGYMRATEIKHGMLINFGSAKIKIKKYIL